MLASLCGVACCWGKTLYATSKNQPKNFGPVDLGTTMDELISFENIELEPLE